MYKFIFLLPVHCATIKYYFRILRYALLPIVHFGGAASIMHECMMLSLIDRYSMFSIT